ncbi:MAG: EAL domain-containing protein [Kofleriaceae bacterium]|nr:EAL domain-containing protein [Kofleriaceae bacterium]
MNVSPIHVLLVDDDEDDFLLVKRYCAQFQGRAATVTWCSSFDSGLAALANGSPDVVLVDYRLGGRTGVDLLREAAGLCRAPFIILTGQGGRETDVEAMQAGAADYLVKGEISSAILERVIRYSMERRRSEERLNHLAMYDTLTGLANRALFQDRLARELLHAQRTQHSVGLLFLDLDRFKTINDSLGHGAGDELLRQVAARLTTVSRKTDTVARLGGDEFVIILGELKDVELADAIANRVREVFDAPFDLDGEPAHVSASIGLTVYPRDTVDQESLVKNADLAMYSAKQSGRNNVQRFRAELAIRASHRLDLENRLRQASRRGELELFYQPQFEVATGRMVSAEGLIRWRTSPTTMMPPLEFLPLAEEIGLMAEIGVWVLHRALRDLCAMRAKGLELDYIAVNVSRTDVSSEWAAAVLKALNDYSVEPTSLEIELTETAFCADAEAMQAALVTLHQRGVRIALDDFGTGYSSLASLMDFPIDVLKLDRRFVRDLPDNKKAARMVQGVVNLCDGIRISTVAEGVENAEQLSFLKDCGCVLVQGYFLARPMPLADLENVLRTHANKG